MVDVKKLIEKQRAKLAGEVEHTIEIVAGGEAVTVGIRRVLPSEWDQLVGACPPVPGREDHAQVGYDPKSLSRGYPNVTLGGEDVDAEEWGELFDVLDPMHRNNIELTIWGANIQESLKELGALGKALAGRRSL